MRDGLLDYKIWNPMTRNLIEWEDLAVDLINLTEFAADDAIIKDHGTEDAHVHIGTFMNKCVTEGGFAYLPFVGFNDIAEVPVYQGYLLNFNNGDKTIYEVKWDKKEGAFGCFFRGESGAEINAFKVGMVQLMRVVGNVYENPELVESTV